MGVKIGKGKLIWHNGDVVSVPVEIDTGNGTPPVKFNVNVYGDSSICFLCEFKNKITEADELKIIEEAGRCRSDPERLGNFNKAKKQTARVKLIWSLSDAVESGMTAEEIHSLVDKAIVSNIQSG